MRWWAHDGRMRETQDSPIQDGSDDASNDERLAGIVEQVRTDVGSGHTHESVLELLSQRVRETGVDVEESRLRELAREITGD